MQIIGETGNENLAMVHVAKSANGKILEFVESVPPPFTRDEKWVIIISTLYGCPVKCRSCDAGSLFTGKPTQDELFFQIDYLIKNRFGDTFVPSTKFKIQFSRMGEPTFNPAVLDVLKEIPSRYDTPGFYPSFSTIAPKGAEDFLNELVSIKETFYQSKFQFQFSIHSTNAQQKEWLIPVKTWSFDEMAKFGNTFHEDSKQKVTLNFAITDKSIVEPEVLLRYFNPENFLIKITPVNPTYKAQENNLTTEKKSLPVYNLITKELETAGYEVIVSIGDLTENEIGSNCGQHVINFLNKNVKIKNSYTYPLL